MPRSAAPPVLAGGWGGVPQTRKRKKNKKKNGKKISKKKPSPAVAVFFAYFFPFFFLFFFGPRRSQVVKGLGAKNVLTESFDRKF